MPDHPTGRVVFEKVESAALAGNPLGDPAERVVPIYLPPGYDEDEDRRYPVIFELAGYTGFGRMLLNPKGWSEPLDVRMDRLIAEGKAEPAIIVLPDCFTRIGGSQYLDSSATGDYATHVVEELVTLVDNEFRTIGTRESRGLAGKSSGGYGALSLGMRHPDTFGAVASHSGDMYFEYCYLPDMPKLWAKLEAHEGSVKKFLEAFEAAPRKKSDMIGAMNMVAMAASYSPNPENTEQMGIDLPIDVETGELRDDVWQRWLANDPVRMVGQKDHADALRQMRAVYIECGTRDEFNLHLGARIMAKRLRELGIEHEHAEFDDGHFDILYRYDESLIRLSNVLAKE